MTSTTLPHTWIGSPNYARGRGRMDYISLHIMAGFLAGTDSTFSKLSAGISSTYGIGANGDIHQYVDEDNTAFADGSYSSNLQSISIEHEGGLRNAPNTDACVNASAQLCADIARRYGWSQLIHGQNIRLHREIPPYSHRACPDKCPNPLRWEEIITKANQLLAHEGAGNVSSQDLYETKGSDGRNIFDGVIQTRNELKDRAVDALYQAKGNDGRNIFDGIIQARYEIADLKTQLTALTATVETLAKAVGANPSDISSIIAKAVADKLATLDIKLTTEGA